MPVARICRLGSLCAVLAIAAACGDSTAPTLRPVTVDSLLAEFNQVQSLSAPAAGVGGGLARTATIPNGEGCAFNSSNQRFVCPTSTAGGITVTMYYQLLDASNAPLSSFDVTKVAAIRRVTDVSGTISTSGPPPTTTTFTAHDDATLSGLLTDTHTLNSTGNSDAAITSSGQTITVATTQSVANLVLPERGDKNAYPKSGTITVDATTSVSGMSVATRVTLTFNGTSVMTMVLSSGGTSQTCTFDLAKPEAAPVCS
jgi:hypothetical protein